IPKKFPTAPQAARQAIIDLKPGKVEQVLRRWFVYRGLSVTGGMLGASMMTGHTSPYIYGMAALDGVISLPLGARTLTRSMLRNPEIADLAWQAVSAKGLDKARVAGKAAASVLAALNAQHVQEKMRLEQQQRDEAGEP